MTVVFKKSIILRLGGYPEHLLQMQDFALWGNLLSKGYKGFNINESLVKVRAGSELLNRRKGLHYLKRELGALKFVKEKGLINNFEFVFIASLKTIVRLLPVNILEFLYNRILRSKK